MSIMLKGSLVGIGYGKSILIPFLLISSLLTGAALADPPPGVENGDLFVGAATGVAFGGFTGRGIFRVRGGVAEPFCMAPTDGNLPEFFALPEEIIVDSAGRVVFLAALGPEGFGGTHIGLLRCNGVGVPPERLAILRTGAGDLDAGWPVPFPDETFIGTSGLHLARLRLIQIDDLTSLPTVGTVDAYVFAVQTRASDGSVGETRTVRYRADTDEWDVGPEPPWGILPGYANPLPMPDMFFHGGSTYAAADGALRRTDDPLGLGVSGNIGGVDFTLQLSLFGGYRQIVGLIRDDQSVPNVVNCTGDNLSEPPSKAEPSVGGFYGSMTGFQAGVLFDGYGDLGLVLRSDAGPAGHPYLTRVSQALLNFDPFDDLGDWFYRSTTGCIPEASFKYTPILPFFDDVGASNAVASIADSPQGLIGINAGRIVRVVPGTGLVTIVSGLISPRGLAAYPTAVAAGPGIVVIIRLDSPLDALLTDTNGRRIGVDPLSGLPVNDFGTRGYVSPAGSEPSFIAVFGPQSGTWQLRRRGTGSGPYTIHVYGIDLDQPVGTHAAIVGLARPGDMGNANFALNTNGRAAFVDTDGDTVADGIDNCINHLNTAQSDTDADGFGNRCDADFDNSGFVNITDLGIFKSRFGTSNAGADLDGNGFVNITDLGIFKSLFGKAPGPSGLVP